MASQYAPDERNEEFIHFVRRELQPGLDGESNEVEFISPNKTKKYWTKRSENRIARAINHNINARPVTIEKGYLTIFSILVYISKTYLIKYFTSYGFQDQQLPLLDTRRFGTDPAIVRDMEDFCENQWTFCPVLFFSHFPMDKRNIPSRQILPIKYEKRIMTKPNHSKSVIRVVTLHPECYDSDWSLSDTVVFKEYRTRERDDLRSSWIKEYNAFVKIDSCENIVQYLGSFEQNNRCFMVLEYAPAGSLLELFKRNEPPATPEERRYFLYGLMGLTMAIDKIQNLGGGPKTQRTGFAHRDIKPANILVFPGTDGLYSAGFKMKLADFDTATPELPIDEAEFSLQDNDGNRTYCAPEASRIYTYQDKTIRPVPLSSDIWSLGCVFSEALVWMAGKMTALNKAASDRRNEIETYYPLMVNSSYGECFHNAKTALNCVFESQQTAIETLEGPTNLSGSVCSLIKQGMLVPADKRLSPISLWHNFQSKYDDLFPCAAGGTNNSSTYSHSQPLGLAITSPASIGRLPRERDLQSSYQHTPSNSEIGRVTIANSSHPQPHSVTSLPAHESFSNRASIQPQSPAVTNHGADQEFSGIGSRFESTPKLQTDGFNTSEDLTSNTTNIRSPRQNEYPQFDCKSPINNSGEPNRLFPSRDQQISSSLYRSTTVDDVVQYRGFKAKKDRLPGYEQFCHRIGRRHFMFIIDDSISMRGVKSEVLKMVEALVWLVRDIDSTGPEIRFTSRPKKRYPRGPGITRRFYTADMLTSPLRHWEDGDGAEYECNMKHVLNQIFEDASIVDPKNPTSVLIFTNGSWDVDTVEDRGVEECITNVIGNMRRKRISNTGFTFQFVSFGDDQDGLARLTYLDDYAPFGGSIGSRVDIVDHKRYTDNVWSILIGSVSPKVDESSQGASTGRRSPY